MDRAQAAAEGTRKAAEEVAQLEARITASKAAAPSEGQPQEGWQAMFAGIAAGADTPQEALSRLTMLLDQPPQRLPHRQQQSPPQQPQQHQAQKQQSEQRQQRQQQQQQIQPAPIQRRLLLSPARPARFRIGGPASAPSSPMRSPRRSLSRTPAGAERQQSDLEQTPRREGEPAAANTEPLTRTTVFDFAAGMGHAGAPLAAPPHG